MKKKQQEILLVKTHAKNPAKAAKHARNVVVSIIRHLFLIGLSYVVLYPVFYMISNAFKPVSQYYDPSVVWIPKSFTFDNFYIVGLVMDIWGVFKQTLVTEILPALISTAVCMFVGYGLAQFKFRGRALVLAAVILTIIVPPQTISASLYSSYRYFDIFGLLDLIHNVIPAVHSGNLIGTSWVTILPALLGVGLKNGIFIFIYMQFFTGLPKELNEAASIDGCGPFRTFLRIIVPTAKNMVIVVLLLSVVWNWNDYYTPAMFIRTKDTMATAMANFQANLQNLHNIGTGIENIQTANTQIQAACLIAMAPLIVLYILLQKKFSEGIENSGLTGI